MMTAQRPLLDCGYCWSAGSVSNGYCMICGAPGPARHVSIRPAGSPAPRPASSAPSGVALKLRER